MHVPRPASPPPADRDITTWDVHALLGSVRAEPGADLAGVRFLDVPEPIGEGWDNRVYRIGRLGSARDVAVLRVPRRAAAEELLARELTVLRVLAASDDLPMRIPQLLGVVGGSDRPDALLLRWYPGRVAAEGGAEERVAVARALARMLARVHQPAPRHLARNPVRGVALDTRTQYVRRDLDTVGLPAAAERMVRERWHIGLEAERWKGPDLLLHGDPHPGNIVLPDDGASAVLIDWGDATAGDPASDVGGLLLTGHGAVDAAGEPDTADTLLAAYRDGATWEGAEDSGTWDALVQRAHAWAVRYGLAMISAYPPHHPLGAVGYRYLGMGGASTR